MKLIIILLRASLRVFIRRLIGTKKYSWPLKTELVWATTRATMMASHQMGLPWLKKLSANYKAKPKLGNFISIQKVNEDGYTYLKISPKSKDVNKKRLLIYFHGGGYVIGSPETSLEFTTRLTLGTEGLVISPFYPQSPEYIYPAAQKMASNFVKHIMLKFPDWEIFLAGDSAGAALALCAYLNLDSNLKLKVAGCILISPWIDPLTEEGSIISNGENDIGDQGFVQACYHLYMQNKKEEKQFPLHFLEQDLPQMPPTLITIGSAEILLDQAKTLANKLNTNEPVAELKIYEDMFHTFWNMAPIVPQAEILVNDIVNWIHTNC